MSNATNVSFNGDANGNTTTTSGSSSVDPKAATISATLQSTQVGGMTRVENIVPSDASLETEAKAAEATTPEKPEWLPEKFKSPEDLAKAYLELEKKIGKKADEPAKAPADAAKEPETPEAAKAAKEVIGVQAFDEYSKEFLDSGSLSEESYQNLEAKGFGKDIVDAFIRGQQALVTGQINEVYSAVGGQESYQSMIQWAEDALSAEEISTFNDLINSGNHQQTLLAVRGLQSRYQSQNKSPKLLGGAPATANNTQAYRSTAELVTAMSDPRYKTDPAYRRDVERRLEHSDIL